MTALLKNVFFVKLDEIVGKYTNRYKRKKLKLINVTSSIYAEFDVENNDRDPNSKLVIM